MKFVRVPVDAIQLTKDNHKEVLHFIIEHSCSEETDFGVRVNKVNEFTINNGDWIVHEQNRVFKIDDMSFKANFKEAKEN